MPSRRTASFTNRIWIWARQRWLTVVAVLGGLAAIVGFLANLTSLLCFFGIRCASASPPAPATQLAPGVVIQYIEYHPAGDDVAGEYVLLKNESSAEVDLAGWTLADEANHFFRFPPFTLSAAASVRVWTKTGNNTEADLYWNRNSSVWDNEGGDTASLRDAGGVLIAQFNYP